MRGRKRLGLHERREMAHFSNTPTLFFCFWVLRLHLFPSLSLQKPKKPIHPTRESPLFFYISSRSFRLFSQILRSLSFFLLLLLSIRVRQILSISLFFADSRSDPGNFRPDPSFFHQIWWLVYVFLNSIHLVFDKFSWKTRCLRSNLKVFSFFFDNQSDLHIFRFVLIHVINLGFIFRSGNDFCGFSVYRL